MHGPGRDAKSPAPVRERNTPVRARARAERGSRPFFWRLPPRAAGPPPPEQRVENRLGAGRDRPGERQSQATHAAACAFDGRFDDLCGLPLGAGAPPAQGEPAAGRAAALPAPRGACYAWTMDGITAWITPALLVALFAWLRFDMRELRREVRDDIRNLSKRFDDRLDGMNQRFDDRLDGMNQRFDELSKRFDDRLDGMNKRFDELNKQFNDRFDQMQRELGDLRERMARLEGALEGFLAGRRDRDAA